MQYEKVLTVVKDTACLAISFSGIIYQQVTGNVNPYLLGVYLALLAPVAVPAVRRLQPGGGGPDTTEPSSLPPVPPQPSPQESSSAP